ncbi:MAG: hypothetical protein HYS40_02885 [Gemmatimonadetes bacterium]|nr:hypothetical protein [Gemmatimonadota bacterium]
MQFARSLVCGAVAALVLMPPAAALQVAPTTPLADSTVVVAIRLTDGSELIGRVVAADDTALIVVTNAGLRVVVPRAAVGSWRAMRGHMAGGAYRLTDPNVSRLFFAPTGRNLQAGEGYFADYFLFFPFVAVGVHDRLTVAAGMSLFPGASSQLLYVAPKIGVAQGERLNFAVGGIYASLPEGEGNIGAGYAALTVGSEDAAATFLAGYPFADGEFTDAPGFVGGGEARLSARTKFLAEVWKLPGVDELPAVFGLRFFGERIAVDFGLVHVIGADTEGFPFFPWVDFVVNW